MNATTTDRFADKQACIDLRRKLLARHYRHLWACMVAEWKSPDPDDRVWQMYSANYLVRTAGVRWALDPLTLRQRILRVPMVDAVQGKHHPS